VGKVRRNNVAKYEFNMYFTFVKNNWGGVPKNKIGMAFSYMYMCITIRKLNIHKITHLMNKSFIF
jgi:hypothetical protein